MKKSMSSGLFFVIGFVFCALTLKTIYGSPAGSFFSGSDAKAKQAVLAGLNASPSPARHFAGDSVVADAAAKLEPAIVEVHTLGKAVQQTSPFGSDPVFRRFFGGGDSAAPIQPHGAGSGVIISSDGYIVTNNHVVANTETVTVKVGEKGYTAKVIGTDPVSDIAVVKIDNGGKPLPVAELGNSDDLRIGDWAIAIGNPLDIGTTVTLGIVSAVNRTGLSAEAHPLQSVIQTDAAINPGNSGGALANINGQVIGINEAIYSPTGSNVGIGFAIPINTAKKIAAELIQNGKIVRPYLGISYAPLKGFPQQARSQMGISLTSDNGVVVQQIYPGSPAEKAGLQIYDVILQANGQKITDVDQLNTIIQKSKIGETMTLLLSRNGQNHIVVVTLKERPDSFGAAVLQGPQSQDPQDQQDPQMVPVP